MLIFKPKPTKAETFTAGYVTSPPQPLGLRIEVCLLFSLFCSKATSLPYQSWPTT